MSEGPYQILVDAALATLFAVIGLLSLGAGLVWRAGRAPGLVLGVALIQHSANRLAASEAVRAAALCRYGSGSPASPAT